MILLILLKKTDFDNKQKFFTSHKYESYSLSKKVKATSTKGFTKDLINSVLNGRNYFSSEKFQNYLVFIPAKKLHIFSTFHILVTLLGLICGNLIHVRRQHWKYN